VTSATGRPPADIGAMDDVDRRQADLPPVAKLATLTLMLVVAGGIYLAAHVGHPASLVPAVILAAAAALVLVVNVVLLTRIRVFTWDTFFRVTGWALLAYLVMAGILEYVFIYDHTPHRQLVLFTAMLVMFAVDVPLLLGFSVARYQSIPGDVDGLTG
jgi:drug/metabolite transporter (DMT)-like permease